MSGNQSDWSQLEEEDLGCLPTLEPHVQEFLRGEEMLPASMGVGDDLLPDDHKPCPMQSAEWIRWHAQQLDMPAWWQELKEVQGQDNLQEFAWMVQASFEVPKVRSHVAKVDNDHSMLPTHHSIDRDRFMPLPDMWFGTQDFHLTQPQKTLAYAKTLQYWAEKAQPLIPGKPHHLVESILDL